VERRAEERRGQDRTGQDRTLRGTKAGRKKKQSSKERRREENRMDDKREEREDKEKQAAKGKRQEKRKRSRGQLANWKGSPSADLRKPISLSEGGCTIRYGSYPEQGWGLLTCPMLLTRTLLVSLAGSSTALCRNRENSKTSL